MKSEIRVYNISTVFINLVRLRMLLRRPYMRFEEREQMMKQVIDCCEIALLWVAGQRGQSRDDIRTLEE